MNRVPFHVWVAIGAAVLLSSCGSGYRGYKIAPYTVLGMRYHPMSVQQGLSYRDTGMASWYDERKMFGLARGTTALGERFKAGALAGAHKTLPLPCRIRVTNLNNGKSIKLRLNDRGPYVGNRILDVTPRAASRLGFKAAGLTRVRVEVSLDRRWKMAAAVKRTKLKDKARLTDQPGLEI